MSTNSLHPHPEAVKRGRYVAPPTDEQRREFEQGKRAYRNGWSEYACSSDDMVAGWRFCRDHGERHGWQRSPAARGEDSYWLGMMQSTSEVM